MMPQLGVLSTFHARAALEVFNKDCLIKLGTCIAPFEIRKSNKLFEIEINIEEESKKFILHFGELILIPAYKDKYEVKIKVESGIDIGYGKGENFIGKIRGGEVGIILDGRGREIIFEEDNGKRINQIIKWSKNSNEYGG